VLIFNHSATTFTTGQNVRAIYRDAKAARHTFQKSVLKEGKKNIKRPNLTKKLSKVENTKASQLIRSRLS
jgi:hypothetical protein